MQIDREKKLRVSLRSYDFYGSLRHLSQIYFFMRAFNIFSSLPRRRRV